MSSEFEEKVTMVEPSCSCSNCHFKVLLDALLMAIHRDGGQFTTLAGYTVSVAAAGIKFHDMKDELKVLRRRANRTPHE